MELVIEKRELEAEKSNQETLKQLKFYLSGLTEKRKVCNNSDLHFSKTPKKKRRQRKCKGKGQKMA